MKYLPFSRIVSLISLVILLPFLANNSYASDTNLISKTQNIQGSGNSVSPAINEDGNFIAFESTSGNLVGDNNTLTQILLKSVSPDMIYRISVDNNGVAGNAASFSPSISADGKRIVFYSSATNLVNNDTNGLSDVFLHDLTSRTTTLISSTINGVIANQESADAIISGDGNFVVFSSSSTNLVSSITNGKRNIYIKDINTGAIDIISKNSNGNIGDQDSFSPVISYNGRYI